jgi:D-beta-D-heptose 7-phosphate kinase/D-beta-D-heptose 1-phosphate adenosyltransferase
MDRLETGRAEEILGAMQHVRALVVGDLMLDEYVAGVVDRISPEAPVPVVRVEEERWAVGGAANVAANVAALGAVCDVVGVVGDDAGGRRLTEALDALGTRIGGVVVAADRPTTVKTRVLARSQQVVRFDRETDADVGDDLADALISAIRREAPDCQVLILEDYNKGVLTPPVIDAALEAGRMLGIPTVVDPKRLRFFAYAGATVFKPNAKELADALGEHLCPDEPAWMEATRRRLECDTLLLTLGERGVALATRDGRLLRVPAVARSVYDVSGAGDTVVAVTAVALAAGADEVEAAILANHAAAIEVQKAGVATVSPREILEHTHTYNSTDEDE